MLIILFIILSLLVILEKKITELPAMYPRNTRCVLSLNGLLGVGQSFGEAGNDLEYFTSE